MNAGTVPFHAGSPGAQQSMIKVSSQVGGTTAPIILYVKNVPILTNSVPQDIAVLLVPEGVTRWCVGTPVNNGSSAGTIVTEVFGQGGMNNANFQLFDSPYGGGNGVTATFSGPQNVAGSNSRVAFAGLNPGTSTSTFTSSTIYIRQSQASSWAGVCSFYLAIFPLP